ncbi:MAG: acyltransferase [Rickettsiales bacterium]
MDVATNNNESGKSERLHSLDVLRGIAAFIVVFGHLFLMYPEALRMEIPTWIRISILRVLVNGHASVILFFVLSGYVLSIPFLRGDSQPYFAYVAKRICRIYIPFAISILLAIALYSLSTSPEPGLVSKWFYQEWSGTALTIENITKHLIMTGVADEMWLNGVMWSLVVELRISIIFPILIYLCNFHRLSIFMATLIYLVTATIIILYDMPMKTADSLAGTFIITLRFVPFFMAGIFLVKYHEKIKLRLSQLTKLQISLLIMFILSIYCMPTAIYNNKNVAFLSAIISPEMLNNILKFGADILIGLASCVLIALVRNYGEKIAFFNYAAMRWLGTISYSLYLIHFPLTFFLFSLLIGHLSFLWVCLIVIVASIIIASIFYLAVEKPAMRLGKYLAKTVIPAKAGIQGKTH